MFLARSGGFEPGTGNVRDDDLEQTEQCLKNAEAALEKAGASLADTVRIILYLVDMGDFERVASIMGRVFEDIRPANTTIATPALIDPRLKVEIEITACMQA